MNLYRSIITAFPSGLPYNDAAQLCLRLYCSVDGVPEMLRPECTKDKLAEVFSRLAHEGMIVGEPLTAAIYGASFHRVDEKGHWVEVIASLFKKSDTSDKETGTTLVKTLSLAAKNDVA